MLIYIKLLVDHEINESHKPYSCQSIFMLIHTQSMSCLYLFKIFRLGTLVYELYNYIFIHIKLFVNHEIDAI